MATDTTVKIALTKRKETEIVRCSVKWVVLKITCEWVHFEYSWFVLLANGVKSVLSKYLSMVFSKSK